MWCWKNGSLSKHLDARFQSLPSRPCEHVVTKAAEKQKALFAQRAIFCTLDFWDGKRNARRRLSGTSRLPESCSGQRATPYDARAAAFDEIMAATLGNFSTCGDLRSHPALSQDSGTRNSE